MTWGELWREAQKAAGWIEERLCARGADAATHHLSVASELDDAKDTSGAGGGLGAGQAMAFLLNF